VTAGTNFFILTQTMAFGKNNALVPFVVPRRAFCG